MNQTIHILHKSIPINCRSQASALHTEHGSNNTGHSIKSFIGKCMTHVIEKAPNICCVNTKGSLVLTKCSVMVFDRDGLVADGGDHPVHLHSCTVKGAKKAVSLGVTVRSRASLCAEGCHIN